MTYTECKNLIKHYMVAIGELFLKRFPFLKYLV